MATDGRDPAPPLAKQLEAEGPAFDFYQAVALLERIAGVGSGESAGESVGAGGEPSREAVRFTSTARMSFAPTEIAAITAPPRAGKKSTMEVTFLGLAGAGGPLPTPLSEKVMQASRADSGARDLLDIFNHRLVSLAYRIRKRHSVGLGVTSPEQDDTARYLFALLGLGLPELRGKLAVNDRALLHHTGVFAREVRSMVGLVALLRWHFGVPVEGLPLTGGYYPIEPSDRTTIGPAGSNRLLGRDAVLGERYWDQEAIFDLRLGPIAPERLEELLPPHGEVLIALRDLVRFYAGATLDFRVRILVHQGAPRAPQKLGDRPRLGYTAWLGSPRGTQEVVLTSTALRALRGG
jgi:type VI secretion system protein ImpH